MTNLITLAGEGTRFSKEGVELPKPMIPIDGVPMIFRAVDCLPKANKYVFVCREEHVKKYNIDELLTNRYDNSEIITLDYTTEGQACTAEFGIKNSTILDDDEILISSCDYGLDYKNYDTVNKDIVVWTTTNNDAFSSNPDSYSWVEIEDGLIKNVHVKKSFFNDPYNNHAIVGTFYFKKAKYFLEGLDRIYTKNIKSNNEYYIDNIFNVLDKKINVFGVDGYHCWGTPKDLKNYENNILG